MSTVKKVFSSTWGRVTLALTVGLSVLLGGLPANALTSIARSNYIVRVQPGTDIAVRAFLKSMGDVPTDEIDYVFDGFVVKLADFEVTALKANKDVIDVTPDQTVSLLDTDSNPPSWGLDRLDQAALPLDNSFSYPAQGGAGVRVYIVDTGVQADNPDFAGRVLPGLDMIGTNAENTDCHGHGTHVAGTAAGTRYGIAKKATIVPVRVLGCTGSGSFSGIISALDWIKQNNPAGTPAVVNMSIGGSSYGPMDAAVNSLVSAGIVASVAAGNSNVDACGTSPAAAASAITVAASTSTDARASFSNYGSCIDIFAPGQSIVSDNAFAPGSSTTMSGTSMAAPHVTGAAALVLGQNPTWTPDQVLKALQDNADKGVVTGSLSTADGLLNISFLNSAVTPTPVVGVPDAPTAVTVSGITQTSATVSWTAPANTGGAAITGYTVEYRASATSAWTPIAATGTSSTITGLTATTVYQVQVSAVNSAGTSTPSPIASFTTIGNVPTAPTNAVITQDHGNYVKFSWTAPNSNGGTAISSYTVQQQIGGVWTTVYTASTTSALVSNLSPLTAYAFKIWANNSAGAGPALDLNYTTGPLAPATPVVTLGPITATTATATWPASAQTDSNYPVSYEVSYGLSTSLTPLATFSISTTNYTLTGLRSVSKYWIRVQAVAGKSTSGGNYISFSTVADVPSSPYWLTAVKTSTSVNLNWAVASDGGSPIIDYQLQTATSNSSTAIWTDVANPTAQTYSVALPSAGQVAYYRVAARNSMGLSTYSLVTSIYGPAVLPSAPQNLSLTPVSNGLLITWAAPASNGGAVITSYAIKYSRDNGSTWSTLANVTGTALSYTTTISTPKGQTTLFSVAAVNSVGTGTQAIASYSPTKTKPSAPRTLSAVSVAASAGSGKYLASWQLPVDDGGSVITGYLLQNQDATGAWVTLATTAGSVTSATVDLGASGGVVTLRVIAVNELGQSDPSATLTVTVPFKAATAPQNLVAAANAAVNATALSWQAPAELFGGTVSAYLIQVSTNGGISWVNAATVSGSSLSANAPYPAKGATYQYRVIALTQGGQSPASNVASLTREASIPTAPVVRGISLANGSVPTLTWNAPSDLGGTVLVGYLVEQYVTGQWTEVARIAAGTTSYTGPAAAPGQVLQFRVTAYNSVGSSPASSVAQITAALAKPAAPTNLAVSDANSATALTVSWTAPTDLGGATSFSYRVEVSANGGTSWTGYTVASSATSMQLGRPAKGVTWQIRAVTQTNFGRSDASNVATYSTAASKPAAPVSARVSFNSAGNPVLAWYAPSDNGGSAITGYLVETAVVPYGSKDGSWSEPVSVAGNLLSFTGVRAAPGSTQMFRVTATNAIGNSAASNVASIFVPLLKPAAPTGITLDDTSSAGRLTLGWVAPADLGGAPAPLYYLVETSTNGGMNWSVATSAPATAVSVVLSKPAKGVTAQYRVVTVTGFGRSDASVSVSYSVAATVPSAANSVRAVFGSDGNPIFAWNPPSDLGGSPLLGYRVELGTAVANGNVTWSTPITVAANVLSFVTQRANPGTFQYARVTAFNAVGSAVSAPVTSLMVPLLRPTAPLGLTANLPAGSSSLSLTWQQPADLGGAPSASNYQVERSVDGGVTWAIVAYTTSTSATVAAPYKSSSWSYRVAARTGFGLGEYSAAISFTTPATLPGATSGLNLTLVTASTPAVVRVTWNAPSDNGGSAISAYRIEKSETNGSTWTTVGTTDGNTRALEVASSAPGAYVYYRVFAVNSIGSSTSASVNGLRMPFAAPAQAGAPIVTTASNSTAAAPRISVTWSASTNLGGASLSFYSLQVSTDGTNWVTWANTQALNWYAVRPASGTTLQYRVVTYVSSGLSSVSAVTTVTH
ncbi:MAG: fibronectin type III domain-containing protein [Actinomycetales bacterium]|nr:fibronectin type III domain-containing protein [Actinomycetales bacterium]